MTTYCPQPELNCNQVSSMPETARRATFNNFTLLSPKRYLHRFLNWHATRRIGKINRDAFLHLLKLDDELLDDIGVTRDSVRWAASLPLSEDAARALEETTIRRR